MTDLKNTSTDRRSFVNTLVLCALAVAVNILGGYIAAWTGAPLYLDSVGTIYSAAIGGFMPGIIVGFATNVIKCFMDIESIYYGILNMLIAVTTAYFAHKGFFKKTFKPLLVIPVLALITAIPDALLTWFFSNFNVGGYGESLASYLWHNTFLNGLSSQFISDLLIELADKAISVVAVIIFIKLTPKRVITDFSRQWLWQSQITPKMRKAMKNSKCRRVSVRTKIVLVLLTALVFIAASATAISYMLFRTATIDDHIKLANGLAGLVADEVDGNRADEYIEKGEAAEGYKETEKKLYRLRDSSSDIEYIYVYKIMEDGCHVVFDLDTEEIEGSEPGEVIDFDNAFAQYIPALLKGEEIEPVISDETFGGLLTVYKPVYDDNGVCRCYAAVDISMNLLSNYGYGFVARLISMLLGFFVLILAFGIWFTERSLILPVNTMAYCAGAFAYNSDEAREESVQRLKALDIHTGDEIENLYHAFVKTTEESMQYVTDIQHKTETISKMQNGLIMVLADMVESRDKCTGDHVRKTAAYVQIIMEEMKARGIYEDRLTDQFIEDVKNAAPLHDIGKIYISDVVLNKPGKLTDEEFEIMRSHTTLGSTIIDRAIEIVPESGYLEEAKNLSEYHHEKWNGKGYPHGISGEDIPLSARIMAVADVFDALVSRRSYKEPFTFEKAVEIIREDAGTHFDPLVVEAFLGAEDRVREVAEEFEKYSKENK